MEQTKRFCFVAKALGFVLLFCTWTTVAAAIDNETCMECHEDESLTRTDSTGVKDSLYVDYEKFKYSVHNVNDVACVDCHADITELNMDEDVPHPVDLKPVACQNCHDDVAEAYKNSVHQKMSRKGVTVPCYACHDYHTTVPLEYTTVAERQKSFCLKCHDPNNYHDWLPAKENHFALVDCTVCHAPNVSRHVNLRFFDLADKQFLKGNVMLQRMGISEEKFVALVDRDSNGIVNVDEFDDMVYMLRKHKMRGVFHGELVADMDPVLHQVNRGAASRDCSQCHSAISSFFKDVRLIFVMDDGSAISLKVDRRILQTYYAAFNALGTTRVRLLDMIGIVLIAGGLTVVLIHLTIRILTIPLRRRKKDRS